MQFVVYQAQQLLLMRAKVERTSQITDQKFSRMFTTESLLINHPQCPTKGNGGIYEIWMKILITWENGFDITQ